MLTFPTNITFPQYPLSSKKYLVYSSSEITADFDGVSYCNVSVLGQYGENLYEIELSAFWWEDDSGTYSRGAERYTTLVLSNNEGEEVNVTITQYFDVCSYEFDGEPNAMILPSAGGNASIYFKAYDANLRPSDTELVFIGSDPFTATSLTSSEYDGDKYGCLLQATVSETPNSQQRVVYVGLFNNSSPALLNDVYEWICIVQNAPISFPVWKDTFHFFRTYDDYVNYSLVTNGALFFNGRAYYLPGDSLNGVEINLNRTLEYYLPSTYVPENNGQWIKDTNSRSFNVKVGNDIAQDYFTWADYSYKESLAGTRPLIEPVNGILDVRQLFVMSYMYYGGPSQISIMLRDNDGRTAYLWNGDYATEGKGIYHFASELGMEGKLSIIHSYKTTEYEVKRTCADYCLIYYNKYGGYDSLLVNCTSNGKYQKTDSWTNYQIKKSFRNTTKDFRTEHYLKDITSKWLFHTCWLTDEQAARMDNLIESNRVYLQNLNTKEIIPVVVTDTSLVYKTYSNQGNKLVSYDINVEESHNKIRR